MRPPGRAAGALRLAELAGVTTAPDALVVRRYRAVGLAADLLVAGFVPLLAAGVVAGVAGLLSVVA